MMFNSSFLDPDRSSRQKWAKIINVWKVLLISSNLVIQGELYIEQKRKPSSFPQNIQQFCKNYQEERIKQTVFKKYYII